MIFWEWWSAYPELWDNPGPIANHPYYKFNGLLRWAWQTSGMPFFPVRQLYIDQWSLYLARVEREAEEYQQWLDQQAEAERTNAEYWARCYELAEMIPYELHYMGLSYRRPVQERKDQRPYEKVDYCHVVEKYFDEYAFYFWIATWWPLRPNGVTIEKFFRGADDREIERPGRSRHENPVAMTLTAAFGAQTLIEFNPPENKRPGLWIVVEHRAGRGQIPNRVSYQQCMQQLPKGADPLAFPVGMARNKTMLIDDLAEIYNLGIGGSVGGGKSNMINVILCTFISRNTPADLRVFLVDFKRVELAFYRGIAHLGGDVRYVKRKTSPTHSVSQGVYLLDAPDDTKPEKKPAESRMRTVPNTYEPKANEFVGEPIGRKIVTTGGELVTLLDYLLAEIERRTLLMQGKVKKISTWNKRFPHKKLAYWVVIIDELADVMLQPRWKAKVEPRLIRVIQLGRAMGIHMGIATQTPKSSVITGLIQNNITAWIALRCGNGHASALMLDGKWDAANLPAIRGRGILREADTMREVQTPEITDLTIRAIVKAAQTGQVSAEAAPRTYSIAPDEVFKYALAELDGYCSRDALFKAFKNQNIPWHDITGLLNDYEVAGSPDHFEPEIEIDEVLYYLTPTIGNTPRRLMPVDKFTAEFETKWAQILAVRDAVRRASGAKNGKHPDTDTLQTPAPLTGQDDLEPADDEVYDLFDDSADDDPVGKAAEIAEEYEELLDNSDENILDILERI